MAFLSGMKAKTALVPSQPLESHALINQSCGTKNFGPHQGGLGVFSASEIKFAWSAHMSAKSATVTLPRSSYGAQDMR
jgi:hypothetical protein